MKLEVTLHKKYVFLILGAFVLLAAGVGVIAFGGGNPSVMGHSSGELVEADPTVLASVKDGVSWDELTGIPPGFADRVDNVGGGGSGDERVTCEPLSFVGNDLIRVPDECRYPNICRLFYTGGCPTVDFATGEYSQNVFDISGNAEYWYFSGIVHAGVGSPPTSLSSSGSNGDGQPQAILGSVLDDSFVQGDQDTNHWSLQGGSTCNQLYLCK